MALLGVDVKSLNICQGDGWSVFLDNWGKVAFYVAGHGSSLDDPQTGISAGVVEPRWPDLIWFYREVVGPFSPVTERLGRNVRVALETVPEDVQVRYREVTGAAWPDFRALGLPSGEMRVRK